MNKFCSFLTAPRLKELAKASVNCLRAEHVVWITALLMFSGVTRSCTSVSFFNAVQYGKKKKKSVKGGK